MLFNRIGIMSMTTPREPNDELGTKAKGSLTVLSFMYECGRRGATICEPIGDHARYDIIIDSGKNLFRVQVKSASEARPGAFTCNGRRRNVIYGKKGAKVTGYSKAEVDLVVTFVNGDWYFYPDVELLKNNIRIYPTKDNPARNNWEALELPEKPRFGPPTTR